MTVGSRIAMLALAAGLCLATGSDTPERDGPGQPPPTLEGYGDVDKTCREWTDGCASCARRENGTPGCSTPGIACQPSPLTCRERAEMTPAGTPSSPAQ